MSGDRDSINGPSTEIESTKIDWSIVANFVGQFFYFLFEAVAVLALKPWRCGLKHPFEESALDSRPDIVCSFDSEYSGKYVPMALISIFALSLYVAGYLSFVCWAVWVFPAKVRDQDQTFIRSTRFLFIHWKNECYHWTIYWHVRSLVVALIPTITSWLMTSKDAQDEESSMSHFQVVVLIAVLSVWLSHVSQKQPWRFPRLNHLDRASTFLYIMITLSASYKNESVMALASVILSAMALFFVWYLAYEVYLWYTRSARSTSDFYLCYENDTAG